jgi:hypothetical protein
MALKERTRYKRITASAGGTLVAPGNESFRVRRIYCEPSANDTYLTVTIGSRTIMKLRVAGLSGNAVPYPGQYIGEEDEAVGVNLFSDAEAHGFDMSIPVAQGETLTVTRYAETGEVTLVYDAYDAGEVKSDEPNGSMGKVQRYPHYITNAAAITSSPTTLTSSLQPTGCDQWPVDADDVGSSEKFKLFGIAGAPAGCGNATTNKGYTTYLRLKKAGDTLFDPIDGNGLPFVGNVAATADAPAYTPIASVIGSATPEYPRPRLWFPEPLEFKAGDTLTVELLTADAASAGFAASEIDVCLLLEKTLAA